MSGNHYIQNIKTKQYLAINNDDGNGSNLQTVARILDGAGIFNHKRVEGDLLVIKATTGQMLTVAAPPGIDPGTSTLQWKRSEYIWLATQGSPNIYRIRSNTSDAYWSQKTIDVANAPHLVVLRSADSSDDDAYNWEFIASN